MVTCTRRTVAWFMFTLGWLAAAGVEASAFPVDFGSGFTTKVIQTKGASISVTIGGHGPAVVLLHGYAEDSRMWKPLAQQLAARFTVIAPDLPGIGNSSIPSDKIDMVSSMERIRQSVHALGFTHVEVVGHDIGLMVAYAYAAAHPREVTRLALMDAFLPGVVGWEPVYNNPAAWHFRFYGPTPVALVKGRERLYFEHFWNDFAYDASHSIPEVERRDYAAAYARPGRMAAGFAYFASFQKTASDFAALAKHQLPMPVLVVAGIGNGPALAAQAKAVAPKPTIVLLPHCGHWLMEEQPQQTMAAVTAFLQ